MLQIKVRIVTNNYKPIDYNVNYVNFLIKKENKILYELFMIDTKRLLFVDKISIKEHYNNDTFSFFKKAE